MYMRKTFGLLLTIYLSCLPFFAYTENADSAVQVLLDNFETTPKGLKPVRGEEFPGAKGGIALDKNIAHEGKASCRLTADFNGGGAYVGLWKTIPDTGSINITEIHLWIRSQDVNWVTVRLDDGSGQCHQKKNIHVDKNGEWQKLVLRISDIAGEEHWGGADDGKWHGPLKGFGLNINADSLDGAKKGILWIDDVVAMAAQSNVEKPTILACLLSPEACRPGFGVKVTYRWDAKPMGQDYKVFVHVKGPDGRTITQNDHLPSVATAVWTGKVEYSHILVLPTDAPEGKYRIMAGLYDHQGKGGRQQANPGKDIIVYPEDTTAYQVGTFTVDKNAPLPDIGNPSLDLTGYKITLDEDFKELPDVSAWGPGTRWIAHTPYAGDFGDAGFANPETGFPFTVSNGILRIEARKTDKWRAGLLSSADPQGNGFSQQYGYFEMRARFPEGPGTWPAFWLLGVPALKEHKKDKSEKKITQIEIDVVEQYGVNPNALHTTVHLWYPDGRHWGEGKPHLVNGMTEDFHTYGVMVTPEYTTFYYDRVELDKVKTLEEAKVPLYILVNLALGGGWPIDKTPNPSYMYVDYVRVYTRGP